MRIEPTIIFNDEEHDLIHKAANAWGVLQSEAERLESEAPTHKMVDTPWGPARKSVEPPAEVARLRKRAEFVRFAYNMHRGASWNTRQVNEVLVGLNELYEVCKRQLDLPDTHWFSDEKGEFPTETPLVLDPKMAVQVIRDSRKRQRDAALMAMDVLQETRRVIHEAEQCGTDGVYRVWPIGWSEPGWKAMGLTGTEAGPYKTQEEAEYALAADGARA